ncbi:hypothetical protein THASP1DRAFT_33813 [Thamnocephalis sphaerospora]|uniref:Uncharacterized protein n=1 Tax=Thamnocephalis sphaerospora TaxID=78915 RepID=A0A4P9XGQ4_9FUNG|nr:hypothetical protein THASP1DRAFT_33813 [Thamnocephalis sphaerospora]|eukprot:RKP04421.1 hypothetical protein THASP1DRAFT_33813 [Thamnocephalis sphaerospora]
MATLDRQIHQRRESRRLSTIPTTHDASKEQTTATHGPVVTVEMIESLQEQIAEKQRALAQLDAEEDAQTPMLWTDKLEAPLSSLRQLEQLKLAMKRAKGNVHAATSSSEEEHTELHATLGQLLDETERRLNYDTDNELAREVSDVLVDAMATGGNGRPDASTLDGTAVPRETIVAALVLQTLRAHGGEMPFTQLKEVVSLHAIDQQCDTQAAVRAVYTLVANTLVDIDRSTRDNMVRLL